MSISIFHLILLAIIGGEPHGRLVTTEDVGRGSKRQLIARNKTWAAPLANLAIVEA